MYKITNKKSGFTQYRNAKETATFFKYNNFKKYNVEEPQEYDLTEYENYIYGALIIVTFVLTFFLLQF